jgi:hypothetical protein
LGVTEFLLHQEVPSALFLLPTLGPHAGRRHQPKYQTCEQQFGFHGPHFLEWLRDGSGDRRTPTVCRFAAGTDRSPVSSRSAFGVGVNPLNTAADDAGP